jgi:adenylate cyclase
VAKLIMITPEEKREYPIEKAKLTIGRMPDNDIEIPDSCVSGHHSEIIRRGGQYLIYDLNSAKGTEVNNQRIDCKVLEDGDRIRIGGCLFVFRCEESTIQMESTYRHSSAELRLKALFGESEVVGSVAEVSDDIKMDLRHSLMKGLPLRTTSEITDRLTKRGVDKFYILYQFGKAVTPTKNLDEVLDTSLRLIFEIVDAERGLIMLRDKRTGKLTPVLAKHRNTGGIPREQIKVSQSIAQRVMKDKVSILTSDADSCSSLEGLNIIRRADAGMSIIQYNIRAVLCVPLWDKDDVFGVLYVDNLAQTKAFDQKDADLLMCIANQIALRIRQEELYQELREEAIRRSNLERFHSPDVVEMILKHGKDFRPAVQESEVTVFFADIEGSTKLATRISPAELTALLNNYYRTACNIIFEYNGCVKFIGDSVMALFGAPIPCEDHALRAVNAGLTLLKHIRQIRESLPEERKYNVRIGINSGVVMHGYVGSTSHQMEYTALGEAVNVAARLEKLAKPNTVALGQRTYELLSGRIQCLRIGETSIRGRKDSLCIYQAAPQ